MPLVLCSISIPRSSKFMSVFVVIRLNLVVFVVVKDQLNF